MPSHTRLIALLVVAVACLAAPAADVVARGGGRSEARVGGRSEARVARLDYPAAPQPRYSPRFVHQLYNNCAFASAEMLLDKWTSGRRKGQQQLLRRSTGIAAVDGGPTLAQLSRAVGRVAGVDLRWSPHGGDPLTWHELLARLANGGGALVNLWPAKLPRQHRRWLPTLTAGHSVYVERYQPAHDRVWLMDPLGRGKGYRGEWIAADDLSRAIWRTGDHVWAAATPARPRDPSLADFDLGEPQHASDGFVDAEMSVTMAYSARRFDARLPSVRLFARWERSPAAEASLAFNDQAAAELARQAALPAAGLTAWAPSSAVAPAEPTTYETLTASLVADGARLSTALTTPSEPGEYVLTMDLRDEQGRSFGDAAPRLSPITVRLYGELAGSVELTGGAPAAAVPGEALPLTVRVANLGSADWSERTTSMWLTAGWNGAEASVRVPLTVASGEAQQVSLSVPVDPESGPATLALVLEGDVTAVVDAEPLELAVDMLPGPLKAADTR